MISVDVWRRRLWTWLPALLFFVLNLGLLSAYRLVYAGQKDALARELEQRRQERVEATRERQDLEELVERFDRNQERIAEFYEQGLSTQSARFTDIVKEIKELAGRASLRPDRISYSEEELESYGLVKRALDFNLDASYLQLRQFINLLELSDYFLSLEEVNLRETASESSTLTVRLRVASYFASEGPGTPEAVRGSP